MIHELTEYVWPCIIGLIIVTLLIKKSTRKTTIKILLRIAITVLVLSVIGFIEFYLFKVNMFVVIYPFTLMELILLFSMIMAFKYLLETILLHKYGFRTMGTIIDIVGGKGSHYKIQYYVNNQEYVCIGNRLTLTDKLKCGSNITILYMGKDPQKSCLAKEDLTSSIILTVATVLLMMGAIILECVAISVI